MSASIRLRGGTEAAKKLRSLEDLKQMKPVVKLAALHLQSKVAKYPPSSEANAPGSYPKKWYERGYGSKWALKGGGVHGRRTSQILGKRWSIKTRDGGLTAIIGNNAKYVRLVQDLAKQAWFHARRGWPTIQKVADEERRFVVQLFQAKLREIVGK